MRFRTTISLHGKNNAGIPVPDDIVEKLDSGKRPAVRVTLGGHTYRSTVARMGGQNLIALNAENRKLSGVQPGDEVDVDLEVDTAPREVAVPSDLQAAFKGETAAKKFFDAMSYTNKSACVTWIESAKKTETREARVVKAIAMLNEGKPPRG
jgi:uncharacterized protein YdeI (YjbR/CyaY-like superfamily)